MIANYTNDAPMVVNDALEFEESHIDRFARVYSRDMQLIVALFIVFFACLVIPISQLVQRYVFASNIIPFSDSILRSGLATILSYGCILLIRP